MRGWPAEKWGIQSLRQTCDTRILRLVSQGSGQQYLENARTFPLPLFYLRIQLVLEVMHDPELIQDCARSWPYADSCAYCANLRLRLV